MVTSISLLHPKELAFYRRPQSRCEGGDCSRSQTPGALDDRVNFLMNSLIMYPKDLVDLQFLP